MCIGNDSRHGIKQHHIISAKYHHIEEHDGMAKPGSNVRLKMEAEYSCNPHICHSHLVCPTPSHSLPPPPPPSLHFSFQAPPWRMGGWCPALPPHIPTRLPLPCGLPSLFPLVHLPRVPVMTLSHLCPCNLMLFLLAVMAHSPITHLCLLQLLL